MTEEIIWKDPPPPKRVENFDWLKALEPLVENVGRWAMIRTVARPTGGINISRLKARQLTIPRADHEWEFTSRTVPGTKNRVEIYARYLGPTGEGES